MGLALIGSVVGCGLGDLVEFSIGGALGKIVGISIQNTGISSILDSMMLFYGNLINLMLFLMEYVNR